MIIFAGQGKLEHVPIHSYVEVIYKTYLSGNFWMPSNHLASHPAGGVRHLDDGIVLPQVPDHTATAEGAGEDVLNLSKRWSL